MQYIYMALNALVHGKVLSTERNVPLISRIAAVHVIYNMSKSQILWFGELVSHDPGILVHLRKKHSIMDENEMVFQFFFKVFFFITINSTCTMTQCYTDPAPTCC